MRTFYIYNINDTYKETYEKYPYQLYKIIENIYYTNKHNIVLSTNYYNQVINKYNKLYLNNYIEANYNLNMCYKERENSHTILTSKEYSTLLISNYYLKLKTTINYPDFFNTLNNYSNNIFICDFDNNDYFWLKKIGKKHKTLNI